MTIVNKQIKWLYFYILLLLTFFSVLKAQSGSIVIGTAIFPVSDIIKNIAGAGTDVFYVVPPNADPHTYEPVPSIVRKIKNVDIYIGISPDFDRRITPYLSQETNILFLFDKKKSGYDDPHVWLSVKSTKRMCENITNFLQKKYPDKSDIFQENLRIYLEKLNDLDRELEYLFREIDSKSFIQWHAAWNRFADDYNLKIAGTIEHGHGRKMSVKEFKDLVLMAKEKGIKIIVAGIKGREKVAESLSREIGGTLLDLDTIGSPYIKDRSNYIDLMRFNGRTLANGLSINNNK